MTRIMVVDDEPDIVYLVSKMLEREGYDVFSADSGEEAVEKLKTERPDLILMDVMMPGMNGWETSKKIKANPELSKIPIAMLTVKSSQNDMEKSFDYGGVNAHIPKPIINKKMLNTIKWLLKNVPKTGDVQ